MHVRLLTQEEHFSAERISSIAFHFRNRDWDKVKAECDAMTEEDWGAFDEDGTLMARIINNHYTVHLNGTHVPMGGIGAVSTLPEYRESGAIRGIFEQLLPAAYERGEVLSALYPFNHAFYRKFGYETCTMGQTYTFPPAVLHGYHFHGQVHAYRAGEDVTPYLTLYNGFAAGFNLSCVPG